MLKSLFDKVAGLWKCSFIKKTLPHRCFPAKLAKFLRAPIFKNINVLHNIEAKVNMYKKAFLLQK